MHVFSPLAFDIHRMFGAGAGWDEVDRLSLSNLGMSAIALAVVAILGASSPRIVGFAAGAGLVIALAALAAAFGWARDRRERSVGKASRHGA